jgi:outer membrane immunogenic protein
MRIAQSILMSTVFTLAATAALAQPPAEAGPPPGVAMPPFSWTGPYAGINAGGSFDAGTRYGDTSGLLANNTNALATGLRPTGHDVRDGGFTGGGQIGYNYEFGGPAGMGPGGPGGLVLGVEADAAYMGLDRTDTLSNTTMIGPLGVPSATPVTRVNQYRGDLDYLGTVRGRLGVAMGPVLVYGTGGWAYGGVNDTATFYGPNAPTTPYFTGTESKIKTGYVYGAGVEFALPTGGFWNDLNFFHSSAVTVKAEYLHYDLGRDTLGMPGVNGGAMIGGYVTHVRTDGDLARLGLNYKF